MNGNYIRARIVVEVRTEKVWNLISVGAYGIMGLKVVKEEVCKEGKYVI